MSTLSSTASDPSAEGTFGGRVARDATMGDVEVTESGPVVTRRQELGAASARSLLLTVLGEFVLPAARPVWTATLIELLADLDVAEKAARQALMRTADSGWITNSRVGRETRWSLTEAGTRLLKEGTDRIYGFAADDRSWDRRWLVVVVAVPENERQLRTQLGWAGLGSINATTWVTPRVNREHEAIRVLQDLGVGAGSWSFLAEAGTLGDERSLARSAWDLEAIEARYEDFLELVARRRPRTDRQALIAQVRLVQEWRRFPLLDPSLPKELLPPRWSGSRAAEVFRERHAAWAPKAQAAWAELMRER